MKLYKFRLEVVIDGQICRTEGNLELSATVMHDNHQNALRATEQALYELFREVLRPPVRAGSETGGSTNTPIGQSQ